MATPVILNLTRTSNNSPNASWNIVYPAYNSGDLVVICAACDNATTTYVTSPSGPNGETISKVGVNQWGGANQEPGQRASVWYYVATATKATGNLTFTPTVANPWGAVIFRVATGNFDPYTPISANLSMGGQFSASNVAQTRAFTANYNDVGGQLLVWGITDTVTLNTTNITTGWTYPDATDIGTLGIWLASRNAAVTASESIAATNFQNAANTVETNCNISYIIRPDSGIFAVDSNGYGASTDEFDFNEPNLLIKGANFGTTQSTSKVYISQDSTLAGGTTEVEITSAVTAWSNTQITMNLTATNLQTSLDTLTVPNLYVIVTVGANEYNRKVLGHRAKAFFMYDTTNITSEGSTTAQLTAPSGKTAAANFSAGKITETNPTSGAAVVSDNYREDEFSMIANVTNAFTSKTYQFRTIYENSTLTITNNDGLVANMSVVVSARNRGFVF